MGMESQPAGAPAPATTDPNCVECTREQVERLVEADPSLVPGGPSALLVEPSVLDPEEVRALLVDLHALLAGAAHPPLLPGQAIGTWLGSLFPGPDAAAETVAGGITAATTSGATVNEAGGDGHPPGTERRRHHAH